MRLAAVQYRPPKARPDAARIDLRVLLDEAGEKGADIIVFPEMATTGYVFDSPAEIGPLTEPARGPTAALLAEGARRWGSWVICGFAERFVHPGRTPPGGGRYATLYNSAWVISPEGLVVSVYRKVLLFDLDKTWAQPGGRRVLVPTAHGMLAPAICMDLNDHGLQTFLRAEQPAVLAFCTNWLYEPGSDLHGYWRQRLGGWSGWAVAANTWGTDRGVTFAGQSAILDPRGRVVAEAPLEGDAVLIVDTDAIGGAAGSVG